MFEPLEDLLVHLLSTIVDALNSIITVKRMEMGFLHHGTLFFSFLFLNDDQAFMKQRAELLVSSPERRGSEMERLDERGGGMSGDERSQRTREQTDMEMKSRGRQRYEHFPHFLFVFTLQKTERVRPNKTFIIPGKLFNVFDIKS